MSLENAQADLDTLLIDIAAAQSTFEVSNGRPWQSQFTHASPPVSPNAQIPDHVTTRPSDMAQDWAGVGITVPAMSCRIRVDVYENESGWGYVVVAEAKVGADVWGKVTNSGNETHRDHDWAIVKDI